MLVFVLACQPAPSDPKDPTTIPSDPSTSSPGTTPPTTPSTTTPSTPGLPIGPSIDDLVGVNAFIDDPLDRLAAFGAVREYHDWSWNDQDGAGYPDNRLSFSLWGGFWDFDAYYRTLADAGTRVFPAMQGSVSSLGGVMPPVSAGADPTDPASYTAHADFLFQVVARYGSVVVPDEQLKLADDQVRVSGLGLLADYEDGNEPDANWVLPGGALLFPPEVYAAMASADYDGDQGRLGPGLGVHAADPSARMVMAGLAGAGPADWVTNVTTYLDGVLAWSAAHRGGSFPADVLNVHLYCFGPDGFGVPNPRPAIPPEECGLADDLAAIDAWRDEHLPDRPLWLTEFGYDTDPASNLRAPANDVATAEVVQAQWLVRSVLAVAEGGFDLATLFVSRDGCSAPDCPGHDIQFTTSGVLREKGDFTPKTAFWFLASFRSALAGTGFVGSVESGAADVRIDRFAAGDGSGAYVVWVPTGTGATHPGYTLAVPGATTVTAVRLVDGSATGEATALPVTAGTVLLDVDETPVVVRVDGLGT